MTTKGIAHIFISNEAIFYQILHFTFTVPNFGSYVRVVYTTN